MARERDRKRTSAADRRRAGTYLAQLGWLAGYPDEAGWRRLDDDVVVETLEHDPMNFWFLARV